jgi:hypothetical protein
MVLVADRFVLLCSETGEQARGERPMAFLSWPTIDISLSTTNPVLFLLLLTLRLSLHSHWYMIRVR